MRSRTLTVDAATADALARTARRFEQDFYGFGLTGGGAKSHVANAALIWARSQGLQPKPTPVGDRQVKLRLRDEFNLLPNPAVVSLLAQSFAYYWAGAQDGAARLAGRATVGITLSQEVIDALNVRAFSEKRPVEEYAAEVLDAAMARAEVRMPATSRKRTWNLRADERLYTRLTERAIGLDEDPDWYIEREVREILRMR